MKILMVTSEYFPYVKVGGLGDVVPKVCEALSAMGHEVIVLLPRYYSIETVRLEQHPAPLSVHLGDQEYWTGLYREVQPDGKTLVYFLEHQDLFGRDGIYVDAEGVDYPDNLIRFGLLSRAAFQLCRMLNWYPDIIHAHDWPTALVLPYLKTREFAGSFLKTRGIFTIHNLGYQGLFPADELASIGFSTSEFHSAGFEFFGRINLMKSALVNSDEISTVSPNYAREVLREELGSGLDGVLQERSDNFRGILNGMDYEYWNPAKDRYIPYPYDEESLESKALNKNFIQEESGLEISSTPAVIGMVSRLVSQKGFDLILGENGSTLDRICTELNVQILILGTGEKRIEQMLMEAATRNSNLRLYLRYNEKMSHIIQAASDFFLVPSEYEPCGLTQMYALRYGTLPIVTRTGGLLDTVSDVSTGTGTGFLIEDPPTEESLFDALSRAVQLYAKRPAEYRKVQLAGMKQRFSWEQSAAEYEAMYRGNPPAQT